MKFKKTPLFMGALLLIIMLIPPHNALAIENKPQPKSLDILTTGDLEGGIVPYIKGVPHSGQIDLHYTATSIIGLGLLDNSNLIIKLPDEFKYVAVQDEFKRAITGSIIYPVLIGSETHEYTPDDITIYADRIVLKNPPATYILGAKFKADIVIDYGKVLDAYPNIPIADNPNGYKFQAVMSDNAMIDFSLLGNKEGTWTSDETKAIIKSN